VSSHIISTGDDGGVLDPGERHGRGDNGELVLLCNGAEAGEVGVVTAGEGGGGARVRAVAAGELVVAAAQLVSTIVHYRK
jgi:hypothetical protein